MRNNSLTPLRRSCRVLIVAVILLFQTAMLLYAAAQKQEYHIDEIYSYIISNSSRADRISHADDLWGTWIDGGELNSFVSVQKGNQFSYKTAYLNTSMDCHPPLYYWLLHTVCSFFPNQFSKWFGIGLNISLFVLTGLGIFLLSDELFSTAVMKYMPLLMYGLSPFAVDTVTFIRMYTLLTFLAVMFTLLSVRMMKYGMTWKRMLAAWATIFLGAMTQYYGIVFCFWGVLFHELILLKKKDFKHFFLYGLGALVSVGLMLAVFPYAITQATGSETNNVGNEVARNLLNFRLWGNMTVYLAKEFIRRISYYATISFLAFAVLVLLLGCLALCAGKRLPKGANRPQAFWLLGTTVLAILSISFIGGEYVYLRYIYFLIPFLYILVLLALEVLLAGRDAWKRVILCLMIAFSVGNAVLGTALNRSAYLFQSTHADDLVLEKYHEYPCVLSAGIKRSTAIPTGNLIGLSGFSSLYMDAEGNLLDSGLIADALRENSTCVVFVPNSPYWVKATGVDAFFFRKRFRKDVTIPSSVTAV